MLTGGSFPRRTCARPSTTSRQSMATSPWSTSTWPTSNVRCSVMASATRPRSAEESPEKKSNLASSAKRAARAASWGTDARLTRPFVGRFDDRGGRQQQLLPAGGGHELQAGRKGTGGGHRQREGRHPGQV